MNKSIKITTKNTKSEWKRISEVDKYSCAVINKDDGTD